MINDRNSKIIIASENMVDVMLNMLKAASAQNDLEFSKAAAVKFVEKFISMLIYKTMIEVTDSSGTRDRKFHKASDSYKTMKHDIQESVALAFGSAMFAFSGSEIEYYCKLIPIGEPINSEMC